MSVRHYDTQTRHSQGSAQGNFGDNFAPALLSLDLDPHSWSQGRTTQRLLTQRCVSSNPLPEVDEVRQQRDAEAEDHRGPHRHFVDEVNQQAQHETEDERANDRVAALGVLCGAGEGRPGTAFPNERGYFDDEKRTNPDSAPNGVAEIPVPHFAVLFEPSFLPRKRALVATPMTIPSNVNSDRNRFARKEESAMTTASAKFTPLYYG